ncbi:MAG: Loki-CTERM sorting domain-containing protein [Promethearchaeota archaeon]
MWNSAGEGNLIIRIHANDSLGYLRHRDLLIMKDTVKPMIIINSPSEGAIFRKNAPIFNLTITDINLEDSIGYYINDSPIPFLIQVVSGINIIHINESEWDALPEGNVTIRFSMTDKAGNVNEVTITLIKQLPSGTSQPAIPGYNLVIIFSSIAIFSIIIKKKKLY